VTVIAVRRLRLAGPGSGLPDRITHERFQPTDRYLGTAAPVRAGVGRIPVTLLFAVIIIYLALAALFESFRDRPDPDLVRWRCSARCFHVELTQVNGILLNMLHISILNEFAKASTLNIYTQSGCDADRADQQARILIVQFANNLQRRPRPPGGRGQAAGVRLRPILMKGRMALGCCRWSSRRAGRGGRRAMGIVIFSGLSIGPFTLFVVPAMYAFSRRHAASAKQRGPA